MRWCSSLSFCFVAYLLFGYSILYVCAPCHYQWGKKSSLFFRERDENGDAMFFYNASVFFSCCCCCFYYMCMCVIHTTRLYTSTSFHFLCVLIYFFSSSFFWLLYFSTDCTLQSELIKNSIRNQKVRGKLQFFLNFIELIECYCERLICIVTFAENSHNFSSDFIFLSICVSFLFVRFGEKKNIFEIKIKTNTF